MNTQFVRAIARVAVAVFLVTAGLLRGADSSFAETKAKAEKGDAGSQSALGVMYHRGRGVEKDHVEAMKWYRKAAEQNDADAQFGLGMLLARDQGVKEDVAEAVKWLRKAAEQNHSMAQVLLGGCYRFGEGVEKDYVEAVKWFRKAAEQNYAYAQLNLGVMYHTGEGVEKDLVEAVKWYRKAAEQNHPDAQCNLGQCYFKGEGVEKDGVEAATWFRKAAEQNNAVAQSLLGALYDLGTGVEVDPTEAAKWYRKAAEQNLAAAQFSLGCMYDKGQGVEKDLVEAVKWYRKAAEQNLAEAQLSLGWMYDKGQGVEKDLVEAVKLYRKAAEQNHARAQSILSGMYFGGRGVEKDAVEAYAWLNLAARTDAKAAELRERLEKIISPQVVAEGQKRTKELRALVDARSTNSSPTIIFEDEQSLPSDSPKASGTGFFITDDGYFVTNEHVVSEAAKVRVFTATGNIEARVVKLDKANDLALLKAVGKFTALPIVTSRSVRLGATAATVGFPNIGLQGFSPKLAKGEIASLSGAHDDARHFQISTPVQPGNSGGALVDERGNVIGVVVAKLSQTAALATSGTLAENVNYAVKSSFLLGFLESVPQVSEKLKEPITTLQPFEDVVKRAEEAAVLVLVY